MNAKHLRIVTELTDTLRRVMNDPIGLDEAAMDDHDICMQALFELHGTVLEATIAHAIANPRLIGYYANRIADEAQ